IDLAQDQSTSQRRPASHRQPSVHHFRDRRLYVLASAALAICELAGMAALVRAYQIAETTRSNTSEFVWFWVGMFLLELPIVGLVARRATQPPVRTALLTLYG